MGRVGARGGWGVWGVGGGWAVLLTSFVRFRCSGLRFFAPSFLPLLAAFSVLLFILRGSGVGWWLKWQHLPPFSPSSGLGISSSTFGLGLKGLLFGPKLGAHRMHLRPPARAVLGGRGEWVLIQGQLSPQPQAGGVSRAVRCGFLCVASGKRGMKHALEQPARHEA